jgi:hypothetical protein
MSEGKDFIISPEQVQSKIKIETVKLYPKLQYDLDSDIEEQINGDEKFEDYIDKNSIRPFTKNALFILFNWNGIKFLDKWELQRKININHATELAKSMRLDWKKYKQFVFYDPIHIGTKTNDVEKKYYVLDGQHRLEAYLYFYSKNTYPIQQIPAILWTADNDDHFIELFNRINTRISIDKLKLVQYKIIEIMELCEKKYGNKMWGNKRPFLNKDNFVNNLRNTDKIHELTSEQIYKKIVEINKNIRSLPRSKRSSKQINSSIHTSAETNDFFLGLDRDMEWIKDIK